MEENGTRSAWGFWKRFLGAEVCQVTSGAAVSLDLSNGAMDSGVHQVPFMYLSSVTRFSGSSLVHSGQAGKARAATISAPVRRPTIGEKTIQGNFYSPIYAKHQFDPIFLFFLTQCLTLTISICSVHFRRALSLVGCPW